MPTKVVDMTEHFRNMGDHYDISDCMLHIFRLEKAGYIPKQNGIVWVQKVEVKDATVLRQDSVQTSA